MIDGPGLALRIEAARTLAQRLELRNYVVYLGFLAILVFFSIALADQGFLTTDNLMNIIRQTTPISIMAIGMAFALSAGEIDLSIGAVVALSALVTGLVLRDVNMLAAIPAGLGVGLGVGLINGLITVKGRIPSFLVTLGSLSAPGRKFGPDVLKGPGEGRRRRGHGEDAVRDRVESRGACGA